MPKGHIKSREVTCNNCSVTFSSTAARAKYCSRKCLDAKNWRDAHPEIRHTKDNKYGVSQMKLSECLICGGNMDTARTYQYCSDKCNTRAYSLRHYWNIAPETFRSTVDSQNNCCVICAKDLTSSKLHIDHDHSCCDKNGSCGKCIRGMLCSNCNWGLGKFFDNPELLRRAADYLENPPGVK